MSLKSAADLQVRELFQWKGREALRLTNSVIELIVLTGGGHLLFEIPSDVESIQDVKAMRDEIIFYENEQVRVFSLPAQGCEAFLCQNASIEVARL